MTALCEHTLTRRLVDRCVMFGVAGVFCCVGSVVVLAWRNNELSDLLAAAAALPLVMLLMGTTLLRHCVRLPATIEAQLEKLAATSSLETALSPLAEPGPAAAGWNAVVQRLRDQRTMASLELRLADSLGGLDNQRWTFAFDALPDGIAICDGGGAVVQANGALCALLHVEDARDVLGKSFLDLVAALRGPGAGAEEAASAGGGATGGRDIKLGDGLSAGVLRMTRVPLSGDAFGANASLWTLRDVTQQKLAEEMRKEFLSTATHELRTPLASIVAYAELLASETELDVEKQKNFCNVINSEASRLSRFVDQLLNVSQMEAGGLSLSRHETDLLRLLDEVVENARPQVAGKQLNFHVRIPPKLPKLMIDKDKIEASLVNLIGNAVKYTPSDGELSLTVEAGADEIHFHVDDTGIGISAEELPRISERFFRSQDSRVRNVTGSGLGLAFTQEVARLHGGRLTIASELNKGSRFTMTLPAK